VEETHLKKGGMVCWAHDAKEGTSSEQSVSATTWAAFSCETTTEDSPLPPSSTRSERPLPARASSLTSTGSAPPMPTVNTRVLPLALAAAEKKEKEG